jgi:hypothetical protein
MPHQGYWNKTGMWAARPRVLTANDIWGPESVIEYPTFWTDLDGVCNTFEGWTGQYQLYDPLPDLEWYLTELRKHCKTLFVSTARPPHDLINISMWLAEVAKVGHLIDGVTNYKIPGTLGIDDRVLCFKGNYRETLLEVPGFSEHWKKPGAGL